MASNTRTKKKASGENTIDEFHLKSLLKLFKNDEISTDELIDQLRNLPFHDLDFAKIDHHRSIRRGFPEVILGEGKSAEHVASIAEVILENSQRLLITRATTEMFSYVHKNIPDSTFNETSQTITVNRQKRVKKIPGVLVVSAGTSDIRVASEAIVTAELMNCEVRHIFDVGVSGIQRILSHLTELQEARVIVVVAGMDGALPAVIGGLTPAPIIAAPTSVGYGANFEGLAALLTMLNSCSPGIGVVNIDNGFGAGYLAAMINTVPRPQID